MSCILYYSNFCQHSNNIIQVLSKSSIKNDIHFICIDKRERTQDGKVALLLENNQKVILPDMVTRVPALLLLKDNYKVIFGDEILQHLQPRQETLTEQATELQMEPAAYSLGGSGGGGAGGGSLLSGVVSDQFSFLDQTSDDLSAKGNGGTRQMYNYAALDYNDTISTPSEDYTPNKMNDNDLEKYQQQRNIDVQKQNIPPQPIN